MLEITARNVNDLFPIGIMHLRERGVAMESRNGPVLEYPDPVSVKYLCPCERVLFNKSRRINPFLHFFEPLWILAGQQDVKFLADIVSRFNDYSDDGETLHGAYGRRMTFPVDQIKSAIKLLREDSDDRRVVLQIRRPEDILYKGKDSPCNLSVLCKIRKGRLNIHVFNRSNDYIWGMAGANMPQFSTLQEYMAGLIGVPVGNYHQTTDSMHVYTENPQWQELKFTSVNVLDPYEQKIVSPYPLFNGIERNKGIFEDDLYNFFDYDKRDGFESPYFREVVAPMWNVLQAYKRKTTALESLTYRIAATDWRLSASNFLENVK